MTICAISDQSAAQQNAPLFDHLVGAIPRRLDPRRTTVAPDDLLGSGAVVRLCLKGMTECGCRNMCGVEKWFITVMRTVHAVTMVQK